MNTKSPFTAIQVANSPLLNINMSFVSKLIDSISNKQLLISVYTPKHTKYSPILAILLSDKFIGKAQLVNLWMSYIEAIVSLAPCISAKQSGKV